MAEAKESRMEQFERLWQGPPGFGSWFAVVNNQRLGKRFMLTSFGFFVAGGILALLMRIQLTVPENTFMGPQVYNQLFTMHGSTMMYLFAVPFLEGLALYLLPLMIGSRDVAFPRLTAFSYWLYLFGGIVFYTSFIVGTIPDAGWFSYTPLSGPEYSGKGIDFWLLGLLMVEIAGLAAGIEIVVTILKLRAPGMSLDKMPIFVWTMLVVGVMILFAFTTLLVATGLLELDRAAGTRFFDADHGGNSLLWQHLFWFFGHPEVYIMFLPATGIVSMVVATYAQRPLMAYSLVVMAILVTGFLSFGLWVHHMYATGLPEMALSFFAAASLMVGVASGVQVFAWIGTLWGTKPKLETSFLYVLGFLFIFTLGGFTGVMVAVVPFDWQVHDTFFIVAHFHYVLIGGVVFPIFAGLHYWLPKITGRMMTESLGRWGFWLTFVGFNLTFFPMHIMGFLGLPRRVYTYPHELELAWYNIVATVGGFVMAAGFVVMVVNFTRSLIRGEKALPNPWNATSLEWTVDSPPPVYSFYRLPNLSRAEARWQRASPSADEVAERACEALEGAPLRWRATLSTDPISARPQAIQFLAGPSLKPLFASLGLLVAFLGVLIEWYLLLPLGLIYATAMFFRWLHPSEEQLRMMRESDVPKRAGLPVFATGADATAWWGMLGLLAMCATGFSVLFYSYFYLWLFSDRWPQGGLPLPEVLFSGLAYGSLVASGGAILLARRWVGAGKLKVAVAGLLAAGSMAILFLILKSLYLFGLDFGHGDNAYASIFHVTSWAMLLFVFVGLLILASAIARLLRQKEPGDAFMVLQMQLTTMFWFFLAGTGAVVFAVLYLAPRMLVL